MQKAVKVSGRLRGSFRGGGGCLGADAKRKKEPLRPDLSCVPKRGEILEMSTRVGRGDNVAWELSRVAIGKCSQLRARDLSKEDRCEAHFCGWLCFFFFSKIKLRIFWKLYFNKSLILILQRYRLQRLSTFLLLLYCNRACSFVWGKDPLKLTYLPSNRSERLATNDKNSIKGTEGTLELNGTSALNCSFGRNDRVILNRWKKKKKEQNNPRQLVKKKEKEKMKERVLVSFKKVFIIISNDHAEQSTFFYVSTRVATGSPVFERKRLASLLNSNATLFASAVLEIMGNLLRFWWSRSELR